MPNPPIAPSSLFSIHESVGPQDALNHASDLLRCIIATAEESCECTQGVSRDLTLSVVHLAQLAKAMVDRSLDCLAKA
ncbi:DUF3077 domain-containing protein [Pseudomonas sp. JDS28PS106]|uniref:DUF6124 family protein n=1 Tax=Pseudomonas sp. JDS28PS106 TaxID=2497235 RepID=UPI002FD26C3C